MLLNEAENWASWEQSGGAQRGGLADNEKAFKDKQFFKCQMPAKTGHSYQSQLYYREYEGKEKKNTDEKQIQDQDSNLLLKRWPK